MTLPSSSRRLLSFLALVMLVLLAACAAPSGPDDPVDSDDTPPPATGGGDEPVLVVVEGDPDGPGLTVEEALGHGPTDDIVVVTGALFVQPDGTVRLCDAIAESFPPQCGGASMRVEALDLDAMELESANDVRWAEAVTLIGSVESGR
jgi:hypothetical protein